MIEKPKCTFVTGFESYLLAQTSRNLTRNYLAILERTRDTFVERFGDLTIEQLQPDVIRTYLVWLSGKDATEGAPAAPRNQAHKALSGATVNIHYRNLKAYCNWLEQEDLVLKSPVRKVKAPRCDSKLPDALTPEEVNELLDQVQGSGDRNAWRDYCVHSFFLDTGVRLSELSGLNIDHLNFAEGYAKVFGKGRKERIVPLGSDLRRDLSRYLLKYREAEQGEPALFTNEHGRRLEPGGIRTMVVRDLTRYVPSTLRKVGPHTERHTAATLKLRQTRDLKTTSLILGHASTRTTERYVHLVGADVLRDVSSSALDELRRARKR